ncbi:MAG: FxsA family protein [Candidatus Lambdaproteobacteria bacterium]|nr:FxsA family protein [Candidatus Lambdaproteobacteria bacterium]
MILILLLFLLVVPALEVLVFTLSGLPLWAIFLEAAVTAALGWRYARREGLDLWTELESDITNRRLPPEEALDAMLVVAGGWLLIVPGLLTDLAGALLLVAALRARLVSAIRAAIRAQMRAH